MITEENTIIRLNDEVLSFLLEYKRTHTELKFWLRRREDTTGSEQGRLEKGQWFQGSNYIFLGLYKASGHQNRTRSIGWVLELEKDFTPRYKILIVWNGETNPKMVGVYKEIVRSFPDLVSIGNDKYEFSLSGLTMKESLGIFLDKYRPRINEIIQQYKTEDLFFIPEADFQKSLTKVLEYRKNKNKKSMSPSVSHSLNTILFGPPGTGKTYNTINTALEIMGVDLVGRKRSDIKDIFEDYVRKGRVQFTTFHQSLSYEDFVEGIKPSAVNDTIVYEVEDGIFKKICDAARVTSGNFEEILERFKKEISALDGHPPRTIKASGTTFDIIYRGTNVFYVQPHNSEKQNPWYPVNIQNIRKVLETDNFAGVYNPTYVREIINHFKSQYGLKKGSNNSSKPSEPYVLIIDEINRGNVSQIFGELITLLEEDKREGAPESISTILPYSKESFSVPPNVYVIGTMNTADRSIEALDTALRRRFFFEEMPPRPELLSPATMVWHFWWNHIDNSWEDKAFIEVEKPLYYLLGYPADKDTKAEKDLLWEPMREEGGPRESQIDRFSEIIFTGIQLDKVLRYINHRIERILGKDHQIGHAYFINVGCLPDLKLAFRNKIVPLLQEYFFGDYGRIGLVLGPAFVQENHSGKKINLLFLPGYDMGDLNQTKVYRMVDFSTWNDEDWISNIKAIYEE